MKLKLGVSLLMISIKFISSHGMLCSTLMSMFFDSWEMFTLEKLVVSSIVSVHSVCIASYLNFEF